MIAHAAHRVGRRAPARAITRPALTAAAIATRMFSFSGSENAAIAAAAETIAATQAVRSLSSE